MRLNVWVPDELLEEVRAANPELNMSGVFQDALRAALACDHDHLQCAGCAAPVRRLDVIEAALSRFYLDAQDVVADQARRGATVEGVARRLKELGQQHQVRIASQLPIPGMTRQERHRAKVHDMPEAAPASAAAPDKPATDAPALRVLGEAG